MKRNDLKKLNKDELLVKLKDSQDAMFNLKFQKALQQLDHPQQISLLKKEIAQFKTIIKEYELGKRG